MRRSLSIKRKRAGPAKRTPTHPRLGLSTCSITWYKAAMAAKLKVGFLGAGKMATALAKGFMRAGLANAKDIMASDPVPGACAAFGKETAARTTDSNAEVARFAQTLILAV